MADHLFSGLAVSDLPAALDWYERLFGTPPSFRPNDTEAVWEIQDGAAVYVEVRPEHAGHSFVTLFVEGHDRRMEELAGRGLTPSSTETYENGVRKALFHDPDGNEVGIGGGPAEG